MGDEKTMYVEMAGSPFLPHDHGEWVVVLGWWVVTTLCCWAAHPVPWSSGRVVSAVGAYLLFVLDKLLVLQLYRRRAWHALDRIAAQGEATETLDDWERRFWLTVTRVHVAVWLLCLGLFLTRFAVSGDVPILGQGRQSW